MNVYELNRLYLCVGFLIYRFEYGYRIPKASAFYQHVQKEKATTNLIFFEKNGLLL